MRLYLDTADTSTIERLSAWGCFAGVTTNPLILSRSRISAERAVSDLCQAQPGDVFVQVDGASADEMEQRVRELDALQPSRVMFKIPPTPVGLAVMARLRDERIWTAATALFSLGQGLLAANAGADILIPFFGRIKESGGRPDREISDMVSLCQRRNGRPKVLVASLKNVEQILESERLGVWGATIPPALADELIHHPGTEAVLERFAES